MSNNRIWLACNVCTQGDDLNSPTLREKCFALAKYYPCTGYFNYPHPEFAREMCEWFDAHRHGGLDLIYRLVYDHPNHGGVMGPVQEAAEE